MPKKKPAATNVAVNATSITNPVIEVQLPIGDVPESVYRPRHINGHLSPRQAEGWKRLVAGLNTRNEIRVHDRELSMVDAARYIGERIMDQIEKIPSNTNRTA